MKISKSDLVNEVQKQINEETDLNVNKDSAGIVLDAVIDVFKETICQGNSFTIQGFGSFEVVVKPAGEVRVPGAGNKTVHKPERYAPKFKFSDSFKEKVTNSEVK